MLLNVGNKCEFRDSFEWDNENCGSSLHYMWRAYERFFRALHPTQQLKRRILSKSLLFIVHLTECFISVNPRRLWAVLIMHYSKYFCIFRTICERYRYIAIVSYQIFVDCILVYYLKMIFWYHTKRYHLVLQVNTPLHLGKIGNDSGTMWSSTHVFLPSPREFIQPTFRPTRTWKWKDTIPYWVYPTNMVSYLYVYSPFL